MSTTLVSTVSTSVTGDLTAVSTSVTGDLTPHVLSANLHDKYADHTGLLNDNYLPRSSPPESPEHLASALNLAGDSSSESDSDDIENFCNGQHIKWIAGSIWETYAYQQHDDESMGWTPVGFKGSDWIILRSKSCFQVLKSNEEINRGSCDSCYSLLNSAQLTKFMNRASAGAVPHTPWKFLNIHQLKKMLIAARKKGQMMELQVYTIYILNFYITYYFQVLNYKRKTNRLQKKLNNYQRMVMLLSRNKIAGVSQILAIAL